MANLGNKKLILQVLKMYFGHFGVETRDIDLRQYDAELVRNLKRLHLIKLKIYF